MQKTNIRVAWKTGITCTILLLGLTTAGQSQTAVQQCTSVSGTIAESVLPLGAAPNDPIGRTLATVTGDLRGAKTAILVSVAPASNGGQTAVTKDVFVTEQKDILVGDGSAKFSPITTGIPPNIEDVLTIKITGGTGRYAKATGSLTVVGLGQNVGPGTGFFTLTYTGSICVPASALRPQAAESEQ